MRRLPALLALLVPMIALAQSPAPAPAKAAPKKLLILPVDGPADDADKAAFEAGLRKELAAYADTVEILPTPKEDPAEVMMEIECLEMDGACVAGFALKYGADLVLRPVQAPDGALKATLLLDDGSESKALAVSAAPDKKLAAQGGKVVAGVFGPPPKPKDATLAVAVEPAGANVFVNARLIGQAPVETRLPPGTYTVVARKEGHKDALREVKLAAGATERLALKIQPIEPAVAVVPPPAAVAGAPLYEEWWFWTAIGVGTAAIIVPTVYYLTRPGSSPTGSMDLVIHPVTFQDDVLLKP